MHILFIASTPPIPTSGGRTRLLNLVKQLAGRHEVSVVCFLQPGETEQLPSVRPFCRRLVTVPFSGFPVLGPWRNRFEGWKRILFERRPLYARTFPVETMRNPLRQLLQEEHFDVAVVNGLSVVEMADELGDLPAILAEENVESDIARQVWQTASDPVRRLRDWLVWRRLLAFEREWLSRFPVCTAVSEADAALLHAMSRRTQVYIVPNGVDSGYFAPPAGERPPALLLFFGVLSYPPNERGLIWFCQNVLPRLTVARPDVELEICGPYQPSSVTALGRLPGVRLTGFVPDIRPKLWQATASVVPLLVGGGTRLKILEALAAGCPVVSTTVGAAGLDLEDGQHLLIADGIDLFTERLLVLLGSQEQRQRLSRAGRHAVEDRYDWSHLALALETACVHAQSLGSRGKGSISGIE
jgi:glycosyltransferase involved in cell wall biosynthesis